MRDVTCKYRIQLTGDTGGVRNCTWTFLDCRHLDRQVSGGEGGRDDDGDPLTAGNHLQVQGDAG